MSDKFIGHTSWENFSVEKDGRNWKIFIDFKRKRVIFQEFLITKEGILFINPAIENKLVDDTLLSVKNLPKNLKKNTLRSLIKGLNKIEAEESKSKTKSKPKGRPPENWLLRASLRVIQIQMKKGNQQTITGIARGLYPKFKNKTHSEDAFIRGIRRKICETKKAYKDEKKLKNIDVTFEHFAKNFLKPKRIPRKIKSKIIQEE